MSAKLISAKLISTGSLAALIAAALSSAPAQAQQVAQQIYAYNQQAPQYAPQYQMPEAAPEQAPQADPRFARQIVNFATQEKPGTIIVDTPNTFLYYVLGNGQAIRYGIGVGREGFTWSGVKQVARKAEWPDWYPPQEMIARQPYLPRMTAGGPGNPLGARALYIGGTEYRIHGTNDPSTIGKDVSSGCIRLTNEDVQDLYSRVQIGAKIVVLPQTRNDTYAQSPLAAPSVQPRERLVQQLPAAAAYAPAPATQTTWNTIRPSGLY